jgi:F0F1-type ATP synthase assembly protein I
MVLGLGLDRLLNLMPLFTVTGTLVGTVLSFLVVYRKLQDEERRRREQKGR